MATTENYGFWYLDPDEEISDFPNQWDYNIDKIDEAIHNASATDDVAASRITGTLAAARIPGLATSKITSGRFPDARMPQAILDRLDELENANRSTGKRNIVDRAEYEVSDGAIYIERQGNAVILQIENLQIDADGSLKLMVIPSGFTPNVSTIQTSIYDKRDNLGYLDVYRSGSTWARLFGPDIKHVANVAWFTDDDWPTSLPGSPA